MATALVTGASSGIGRELAKLFAADGHDVIIVARRRDPLEQLRAQLESEHDTRAFVAALDLTKQDERDALASLLRDVQIDYLVNNAGFAIIGPFATTDLQRELEMIQVHAAAVTHLTKLFLPPMVQRGYGRVLNVASIAAFLPGPFAAVYYATKAYLLSFSEALAEETRGTGVTVTTLCPGRTDTELLAAVDDPERSFLTSPVSALWVAHQGYSGMLAGERLVIPGVANRMVSQLVRLCPRHLLTRLTRFVQKRG